MATLPKASTSRTSVSESNVNSQEFNYDHTLSQITGNAPQSLKKHILTLIKSTSPPFGRSISARNSTKLSELDVDEYVTGESGDGKRKEVVRMVMEVEVHEGTYH